MKRTHQQDDHSLDVPLINKADLGAPVNWLLSGWQDFISMPLKSGLYGLIFVLLGYGVIAASWNSPILILTFITGFFLVAPFLGLGLYHLSYQREQQLQINLGASLLAFLEHKFDMGLLAVFHGIIMVIWIRVTTLISGFYLSQSGISIAGLTEQLFNSPDGVGIVLIFFASGGVLAALVFIVSVISWPMLLESKSSVINAFATSLKVVSENKRVMLVWATLITGLMILGIVTGLLGLLVVMPVLGHASWHAYRDLVVK